MVAEIKAKWLAALRGGEYQQCGTRLRAKDGYCCLGVLCDLWVAGPGAGRGEWAAFPRGQCWPAGFEFTVDGEVGDDHVQELPAVVMEWAGLAEGNPGVEWVDPQGDGTSEGATLAGLNDEYLNFRDIADLIESEL